MTDADPEERGGTGQMSVTSSADAIRSAVAAMNAGDVDGYITHFAPTCERWVSGLDQPLSLDDVAESLRHLVRAFSRLRLDEELLISQGAFVCARWRLRGTQTADYVGLTSNGRSIDVAICEVYEIAGGKVVATWAYQDPGQMFRQMASAATSEGVH
jgi:predicted ester cyclase